MRRIALALCAAAGLGLLLFPTGGSPATQQAVTTDEVQLSPSPTPNGAYVTQVDGEVRLDFTRRHPETGERIGLNDRAVTVFDRLLRVEYNGSGPAEVWFETPTAGTHFYHEEPGQVINERDDSVNLTRGEAVYVGLVIDTTELDSRIEQFDTFEIHIGAPDSDSESSEQVSVNTPDSGPDEREGGSGTPEGSPADGGPGEDDDGPDPDTEPPTGDGPDEREDSGGPETDPESPADGEPDPDTEPPAGDGQDGTPESGPPPEPPEGPLPDLSLDGEDSGELSGTGATDSNPPPELGETPDTTQIAIGGLSWVLLLIAAGVLGMTAAAVLRRRSEER